MRRQNWWSSLSCFNKGDVPIDVSGWTLRDAVSFSFPAGSFLPPGGYLVATQDPAMFEEKFERTALGPWTGKLNNQAENGRAMVFRWRTNQRCRLPSRISLANRWRRARSFDAIDFTIVGE